MLKHVGDKCCCAGECGGKCSCQNKQLEHTGELSLADLQIGDVATIIKIKPQLRNRKKFADVGLVIGTELEMEARAPFGGLWRVKILGTSMALHSEDAACIVLKKKD